MKDNNLKDFYNDIAHNYYNSRNKYRNDGAIVANEIQSYGKKEISILEFGCGGGRCIKFLNGNLKGIKINYTGIDISENLLAFAKKDNPKDKFVCDDIINYIKTTPQESFDFIIGIASFQHIEKYEQRLLLMKNFYKTLKYGGELIMTNRSYSDWFIKKYKSSIITSILKTIYTLGAHNARDLSIPRKSNQKTYYRFYHIFSKKELSLLCKENFFYIKNLSYINNKGESINNRELSSNSIIIAQKNPQKLDNVRQT